MVTKSENLSIVQRLLELSRNKMDYTLLPKSFKEEYIFLANVLHCAKKDYQQKFNDAFRDAVSYYKRNLEESGTHGWWNNPEELVYIQMQINQIDYIIYGGDVIEQKELKFREELKEEAYKDLILQIDRTVLMSDEELKEFNAEVNRLSIEICDELLAEIKLEEKQKKV